MTIIAQDGVNRITPESVSGEMHPTIAGSSKKLAAISLFSGAGGMDVGFRNAGFETVLANDIDPLACESFRMNHGDVIVEGDVRALFPLASRLQGIDLIFGGPPCQGFSVAGKMDPFDGRNQLIENFLQLVGLIRPRAFVCENVKALAALTRWRAVRNRLLSESSRLGYESALLVLDASHFGVPQARERMFLIGFRRDTLRAADRIHAALKILLADLEVRPPTIQDVIRSLGRAGDDTNSRICRAKITFAKAPILRRSPYAGMLFNGAGRPLAARGLSSTLPASMGGNKTPIVDEAEIFDGAESFVESYHAYLMQGGKPRDGDAPKNLRRLTMDECLAIQTFPSNYRFAGSQSAIFRQIGNAVPCKLGEVVAKTVNLILNSDIPDFILAMLDSARVDRQQFLLGKPSQYA